jgi:hypothetical protein
MLGVTIFGLIFTPLFYVLCRGLGDKATAFARRNRNKTKPDNSPAETL